MYANNYGFGNAAPNFNPAGTPQQGMQPGQQVMFNRQQQFAGMAPQGAFPGANPHMMADANSANSMMQSQGMMPSQGMPGMAPNNQSASLSFSLPCSQQSRDRTGDRH